MELSPSQVSGATFRTVRKGYDHEEVDAFLGQVAKVLEAAQQQAVAMEARARAAVARLQEVTSAEQQAASARALDTTQPMDHPADEVHISPDEAETITRTLLLAQRTADTTIAEADAEAERIRAEARTEAENTIDSTREMSAKLLEEARAEARKASEAELTAAENEVESLVARREFLVGDVDQLEQFLDDQRERLRSAARQIEALCERVPAGLGAVSPPVLSASDDGPGDDTAELFRPMDVDEIPFATASELARSLDEAGVPMPVPRPSEQGADDGGGGDHPDAPRLPIRGVENPASD
jgi:DivIVA domain-containing protein